MRTQSQQWDDIKELTASTLEILHALYRATLAVGGAKKNQIPKQLTVPRPKREPEPEAEPPLPSMDDVRAWLANLTPKKD